MSSPEGGPMDRNSREPMPIVLPPGHPLGELLAAATAPGTARELAGEEAAAAAFRAGGSPSSPNPDSVFNLPESPGRSRGGPRVTRLLNLKLTAAALAVTATVGGVALLANAGIRSDQAGPGVPGTPVAVASSPRPEPQITPTPTPATASSGPAPSRAAQEEGAQEEGAQEGSAQEGSGREGGARETAAPSRSAASARPSACPSATARDDRRGDRDRDRDRRDRWCRERPERDTKRSWRRDSRPQNFTEPASGGLDLGERAVHRMPSKFG
ncbi:hypothetical protein OHA21_47215 [Actinoplanes sp. NBC_00393]|uniref:hypothetical protein n=1 Tax=Actinoplanes sp. NBC_00393 TaxID=2975953 RepID=UPI002E1C98D6